MRKKVILTVGLMLGVWTGLQALSADTPEESYLYIASPEALAEQPVNVGSLSTLRSLTFSMSVEGQLLNVHTKDGATQSFDLGRVERLYFSEHASGIRQQTLSGGGLHYRQGMLHTGTLSAGTPIAIYTADGRLVKQLSATGEPLPLEGLGHGLYLVKADGATCKFVK